MHWFLTIFFRELYTHLAWWYDAVAMITSVGQWFTWQTAAYDALPGGPLLEVGFGTGHTQVDLASRGWKTFGIDLSPQMARISRQRLLENNIEPRLVRADAKALPFPRAAFRSAVSTFPSEYLFATNALREARRVLVPNGSLVVVPAAQITGPGLFDHLAAWLYRFTGQSGPVSSAWRGVFTLVGFSARLETIRLPRANVLRITADVPGEKEHAREG